MLHRIDLAAALIFKNRYCFGAFHDSICASKEKKNEKKKKQELNVLISMETILPSV